MNESEKQFSFTRAASSTSGRSKKQIYQFLAGVIAGTAGFIRDSASIARGRRLCPAGQSGARYTNRWS